MVAPSMLLVDVVPIVGDSRRESPQEPSRVANSRRESSQESSRVGDSRRESSLENLDLFRSQWVLTIGLVLFWSTVRVPVCCAQETSAETVPPVAVDFERDVLPIFEVHCLDCHGESGHEADLRLDSMVEALRGGDSGSAAIVPGNSASSHLIERVLSSDESQRMPPAADPLTEAEVSVLRKWIDEAAAWQAAEQQLGAESIEHWSLLPLQDPAIPDSSQLHPVDAFIEERLKSADLSWSDEATPQRLIRRLYLVMHGLPPTREQIARFMADQSADRWEQLVDRVLDSPRYGERWGTHWLDIVRFGETDGFETNRERPNAFHYRDWVINAFNEDMPYDQFVKQQLAGDALGAPVATAFLVAGPNDIVKGQDELLGLMQRQDELTDMVNTTGTAFLGLTTGCARCHNHKFDPISQSEFYALQAIFSGVEHGERSLPPTPDSASRVAEIEARIDQLTQSLENYQKQRGTRPPVNASENVESIEPTLAKFVRFTILESNASEPCIDELQVFAGDLNVALSDAGTIATSSGDFEHPYHKLEHINDGQFGNQRSWISNSIAGGWIRLEFSEPKQIDEIRWGRDREGVFSDRLALKYRIEASNDAEQWQLLASSDDRLPYGEASTPLLERYDLSSVSANESEVLRAAIDELQGLEDRRNVLARGVAVYAGNFKSPGPTYRLHRGDPTMPREQIRPGAIEILGEMEIPENATEQQRRLALADWITRPEHPLTARVLVNRLWQYQFGIGLVDTPSDFGANGTPPTHPELLDWLAREFMRSGWSIKHMQRLILTSDSWKQDSTPRSEAMAIDASSRLLWRFPPRRLEAEGIRDCILAATGQLDLTMGGAGFSAFEVELENVRHYFPKKEFGPADWRRMVYMTKVRQEKDAVFGIFDCPDGSQVTPKRGRSTTPLQALNLLNSRFVMQQAELFAKRIEMEAQGDDQRIALAYELCFGRTAGPDEIATASEFIAQHGWVQFSRAMLNANEFVFIP